MSCDLARHLEWLEARLDPAAYEWAMMGDDRVVTLRANYGLGAIPSLLG